MSLGVNPSKPMLNQGRSTVRRMGRGAGSRGDASPSGGHARAQGYGESRSTRDRGLRDEQRCPVLRTRTLGDGPGKLERRVRPAAGLRFGSGECVGSPRSEANRPGPADLPLRRKSAPASRQSGANRRPVRLWALSDLHVSHAANRGALEQIPAYPNDWLLLAGDVTQGAQQLDWSFRQLVPKFRRVVWVPGNHELWTLPRVAPELRGVALYERLVRIARNNGVLTPEDPYPIVELRDGPVLIAPLFLLYDYTFRPGTVSRTGVVAWAEETGAVCTDEWLLHPDPYPDRDSWCAARCKEAELRLASYPAALPKVLVNHFPLEQRHAVLPRVPRFTPWCGTRLTHGWHRRFNACAVVYGHLHIRGTAWLDGVPFQEVSLGYPNQWESRRGVGAYLRPVRLAPHGSTSR